MRFNFTVTHVPKAELHTADTLSRAPVGEADENELSHEIGNYVRVVIENLPASEERLRVIRDQQERDPVCKTLKTYCLGDKIEWTGQLKQYYHERDELTVIAERKQNGHSL